MRKWIFVMALFPFWFMTSCYEYGYPAGRGGGVESNVAFQLTFEESASPLVDEVNGIELAESGAPCTYGDTFTGLYRLLSPGASSSADGWGNLAIGSALDIGTNDFVFEEWVEFGAGMGGATLFIVVSNLGTTFVVIGTTDTLPSVAPDLSISLSVPTTAQNFRFTLPYDPRGDGKLHKIRITADRDGNLSAYFDNTAIGTPQSLATFAGKSFEFNAVAVGGEDATLAELRLTIGNATNNSTPVWYP